MSTEPSSHPRLKDAVPRLGWLKAATTPPRSVKRDADLREAITLMMLYDYSQLPVMQGARNVDGIISFRSIVGAKALRNPGATVRECMVKDFKILHQDTPLFDAVRTITQHGFVLVQGGDRTITGLVTMDDIGKRFIAIAEPFWLLEQIENHMRAVIQQNFSVEMLASSVDRSDTVRTVERVSDLTFGEYLRLLQNPVHWDALGVDIDRQAVLERLEEVRQIRNEVMHFHSDSLSEASLEVLRETNRFFYEVSLIAYNTGDESKPKGKGR